MTDCTVIKTPPKGWQPFEGEHSRALPGSCIGSKAGYEGCPQYTSIAYLLGTASQGAQPQSFPDCSQWNYTKLPSCTDEIERCYDHNPSAQSYVEYNTYCWNWSLTEAKLMTLLAETGSDLWFQQQYDISGGGLCVCRDGGITKNNLFFLKANGQFANHHKVCESVAIGVMKLHGIPCCLSLPHS